MIIKEWMDKESLDLYTKKHEPSLL